MLEEKLRSFVESELDGYRSRGLDFSKRHKGKSCYFIQFKINQHAGVIIWDIHLRLLKPVSRNLPKISNHTDLIFVRKNIDWFYRCIANDIFWAIEKAMVGDGRVHFSSRSLIHPDIKKTIRSVGCNWKTGMKGETTGNG